MGPMPQKGAYYGLSETRSRGEVRYEGIVRRWLPGEDPGRSSLLDEQYPLHVRSFELRAVWHLRLWAGVPYI